MLRDSRFIRSIMGGCAVFALAGALAQAQSVSERASATLKTADGEAAGSVSLAQTPNGVLLTATLTSLPPGEHGFHIHETGSCEPDFASAGGHFAPAGAAHGVLSPDGAHAGDMPNIYIGADGALKIEVLNPQISLLPDGEGYLFDEDGAAILIHSGGDDYASQPSGAAGNRIACGAIEKN